MGKRNPLEVFGKDESLRGDGSAVVYTEKIRESIIPIMNIQKFTIGSPNFLNKNGGIIIATSQAPNIRFGSSSSNDIITFLDASEAEYARNIQKYITEFQANSATSVSPQISVADELVKLKALVDDGILTQEEFDRKKNKLLGE